MNRSYHQWIRIAIFNLMLVALLGIIMRYKIVFPLPWIHQKYILHAHSHFAFSGWITQLLMTILVSCLNQQTDPFNKYKPLLTANLLTAYGMLLSFPFQGYGLISICFSTLSIFVSYWFAWKFWKDVNKQSMIAGNWFKAALLFLVISSFGAFTLSVMMANQWMNQQWYLAAVYFFLHFQYNGWFFFACMGLLFTQLAKYNQVIIYHQRIFKLFVFACLPAYCLSVLWLSLPILLYVLVVIAAIAQVAGIWYLWKTIRSYHNSIKTEWTTTAKRIGIWVFIALLIKLLLQLFSTIPSLSDLAYGFRPIVIGYLHLVLLGIISLFLLTMLLVMTKHKSLTLFRNGIIVFTISVLLNEILLMLQGVFAMAYISVVGIQEALLVVSAGLLTGALMIFLGYQKRIYA